MKRSLQTLVRVALNIITSEHKHCSLSVEIDVCTVGGLLLEDKDHSGISPAQTTHNSLFYATAGHT